MKDTPDNLRPARRRLGLGCGEAKVWCIEVAAGTRFRYAQFEFKSAASGQVALATAGRGLSPEAKLPQKMPPQVSENAAWFAKEVQPHEGMLRNYLVGIALPSDIDDLVQESYRRLLRLREQRHVRSPRGLLFALARNAARDLFRRRGTAKTDPVTENEYLNVIDEAPGIAEVVSRRQEIALLADAIEALPERCRAVFILRQFENLSQREIAARLGIAEHTVESQLTKALHRCENFFAAHGFRPESGGSTT